MDVLRLVITVFLLVTACLIQHKDFLAQGHGWKVVRYVVNCDTSTP